MSEENPRPKFHIKAEPINPAADRQQTENKISRANWVIFALALLALGYTIHQALPQDTANQRLFSWLLPFVIIPVLGAGVWLCWRLIRAIYRLPLIHRIFSPLIMVRDVPFERKKEDSHPPEDGNA